MDWTNIVLLDADETRRAEVYRCLAACAPVIPIADASDLGDMWPQSAWFLVHDDEGLLAKLQSAFQSRGAFHPIVVFSDTLDAARVVKAVYGGAVNYIVWPCSASTILDALAEVSDIAAKRCEHAGLRFAARRRVSQLSARELEVVESLRAGKTSKEIGRDLGISHRTVEVHRANAMNRLEVQNAAALVTLLVEAEAQAHAL